MGANETREEEIEIDLREIIGLLLERWQIIVLAGVIIAAGAFVSSKFVLAPVYESTTKVYVLNKQDGGQLTYTDLQTGSQLTKDYIVLVESRAVLEEVILQLGLETTYEGLLGKIHVATPTDTRILEITVEDYSPYEAMTIANAVREAAAKHISSVMDIESVNVVEEANLPQSPSKPSVKKWTMIGGLAGALLAVVILVVAAMLNDTIKTPDDMEKYLNLSSLASIPVAEGTEGNKKKKKKQARQKQAERQDQGKKPEPAEQKQSAKKGGTGKEKGKRSNHLL